MTTPSPPVLLPVGKDLGLNHEPDAAVLRSIQCGAHVHDLDETEYQLWRAAHQEPPADNFDRAALLHAAARPDPTQAIERLLVDGLLIEADLVADPRPVLTCYRLIPTAEGLGNTTEKPDGYRIGRPGSAAIEVSLATYGLWAYSYAVGSMWAGCLDLASAPPAHRSAITVDDAAADLAAHLPLIVSTYFGYLDPLGIARATC